ncbi:hypothetical protein HZS_4809 [Henneguya salminicola]|nr:hypothetical protein HZS_4809 [Henneguya salminicola]
MLTSIFILDFLLINDLAAALDTWVEPTRKFILSPSGLCGWNKNNTLQEEISLIAVCVENAHYYLTARSV